MRGLLKEPTVHFVLLGAALFAGHHLLARPSRAAVERRITVSAAFVDALHADADRRAGRPGDAAERAARVQSYVEEELLYREALALGLDRGDPVVRRRLTQKMEFLLEDPVAAVPPAEAELQAWLDAHPDRYRVAERLTVEQLFFSRDRRGDHARADAEAALDGLAAGGSADRLGDAFPLAGAPVARTPAQLAGTFGESFAGGVAQLPVGQWAGPVESAYGWHVVRVVERSAGRAPTLSEVRSRVQTDLMDTRRREARQQAVQALQRRYDVRIEGGT